MMTPGSANALLLADAGYQVQRSVRLRQSASAYLNRTAGVTPTSNQKGTFSFWIKRGLLSYGTEQWLFAGGSGSFGCYIPTLDKLAFEYFGGSYLVTTQVFRDPSAWYHIVLAVDSTQATAANRAKLYVNGVQVTSFATEQYPTQNATFNWMANGQACFINQFYSGGRYFDGYLTEFNYIDGQALTPASFGEINLVTGVWSAKKYAGTYGTNGFYLNFADNSAATAAAIGKDSSGNGNNWTPNNISVTAGVTYDSMLDVPLGAGGAERGNYCTLNPLVQRWAQPNIVFSEGNLKATVATALNCYNLGTIFPTTGKWYWEGTVVTAGGAIGVADFQLQNTVFTNSVFYYPNGTKDIANVNTSYGATYTTNDVIGVALDCDGGTVTFYKNNTSQGAITLPSGTVGLSAALYVASSSTAMNFGQRPFAYTPPTGFKALHTGNLPDAVIKKGSQWFDATVYAGNNSTQSIVNAGAFQPDLVWVKDRTTGSSHRIVDAVRGATIKLSSDLTAAESTESTGVTAFNSDGFSIGAAGAYNTSGRSYVAWQWKANGAAVSNTAGSITSQVSAGVSQGFSVVTYTGTGANATVGHGLGVAPSMVIVKNRGAGNAWDIYTAMTGANAYLSFATAAVASGLFPSVATSLVFSITGGAGGQGASGGTYVAYCFAPVAGYSAFGSYTGNGSADGPFVFCGFRPRFVMFKRTDSAGSWFMEDTSRGTFNVMGPELYANSSDAEGPVSRLDVLSNGFKMRAANAGDNASGGTYIFMAFAENPFKNSLAR